MSSKPEHTMWSCDTGQLMVCFDSCQLTMTWMPKIKYVHVAMVIGATLLFFKLLVHGHTCTYVCTTVT